MSTFERYLTLWVGLCIAAGIALGHAVPGVFQAIGRAEVAKVNLPVALLIWLMIIPGAALATVVGVLIEVPVMLSVVKIVNATKDWYERGAAVRRHMRAAGLAADRSDGRARRQRAGHRGVEDQAPPRVRCAP
jgi:ACR3 family arsenite efflux pump ArsB